MAVTDDLNDLKRAVLREQADEVRQWLADHPAPPMPEYVSTIDGHILRLSPCRTQYIVLSGLGDPSEARMTVQRLNEAHRQEEAVTALAKEQAAAEQAKAKAKPKRKVTKKTAEKEPEPEG